MLLKQIHHKRLVPLQWHLRRVNTNDRVEQVQQVGGLVVSLVDELDNPTQAAGQKFGGELEITSENFFQAARHRLQ